MADILQMPFYSIALRIKCSEIWKKEQTVVHENVVENAIYWISAISLKAECLNT